MNWPIHNDCTIFFSADSELQHTIKEQQSQTSLFVKMSVHLWREALVFDSITQARCGVRGWQMEEFGCAW